MGGDRSAVLLLDEGFRDLAKRLLQGGEREGTMGEGTFSDYQMCCRS